MLLHNMENLNLLYNIILIFEFGYLVHVLYVQFNTKK